MNAVKAAEKFVIVATETDKSALFGLIPGTDYTW